MITQARLKELLHYDPDTGVFTWVAFRSGRAKLGAIAGTFKTIHKKQYVYICIEYKKYRAHRLAWLYVYGIFPPSQIDHIDGNGINNKLENLRIVSAQENQRNQCLSSANKSGFTGVRWIEERTKWGAQIKISGKIINLGNFDNLIDSVAARIRANKYYEFHFNHGHSKPL